MKMEKMKMEKIIRYIPPYNLMNLPDRERSRLNKIGNIIYGVVGGIALFGSVFIGGVNGTQKYFDYLNREKITYSNQLRDELFKKPGLADKNKNGELDLIEVAEMYEKMGLGEKVLKTGRFPSLSIDDLERAVESYETEK